MQVSRLLFPETCKSCTAECPLQLDGQHRAYLAGACKVRPKIDAWAAGSRARLAHFRPGARSPPVALIRGNVW